MITAVHDLRCEVQAPQRARRWIAQCLRAQLSGDGAAAGLIDDAVLCVSELVTNAVHAGCSALRVQLAVDDHSVRVSVVDDAPGHPVPQHAGPEQRSGRGLRLVSALSRRWGVDPAVQGNVRGKEVWAELARTG